jgi:3-deoxy-D-manno-octulosonic-acid transferase
MLFRVLRGKEDVSRIKERFGFASIAHPKKSLVWIHAASVGEFLAVLPLIDILTTKYKLKILLTTGTVTSANLAATRLPEGVIHQYFTLDFLLFVNKFLKYWKPSLVLWTESELWPNTLHQIAKRCPIVLINARMSDSSYKRWQRYKNLIRQVMSNFSLVLTQSKQDYERFATFYEGELYNVGNLKYAASPAHCDQKILEDFQNMITGRLVIMAASTHYNEEQQIAEIYKGIRNKYDNVLLIIAPRHPQRTESILSDLYQIYPFKVSIRSKKEPIYENTDIYIADTIGEYGLFYRIAEIVFVGGSLIYHGGQNILEPARLGNVILFGPYMHNFQEIKQEFLDNEASIQVNDVKELNEEIISLIENKKIVEQYKERAKDLVTSKDKVIDELIKHLHPWIDISF